MSDIVTGYNDQLVSKGKSMLDSVAEFKDRSDGADRCMLVIERGNK